MRFTRDSVHATALSLTTILGAWYKKTSVKTPATAFSRQRGYAQSFAQLFKTFSWSAPVIWAQCPHHSASSSRPFWNSFSLSFARSRHQNSPFRGSARKPFFMRGLRPFHWQVTCPASCTGEMGSSRGRGVRPMCQGTVGGIFSCPAPQLFLLASPSFWLAFCTGFA